MSTYTLTASIGGSELEISMKQGPGTPGESYRPANGTEGDMFESDFCWLCRKFYDPGDGTYKDDGFHCPIHCSAFLFPEDHPEYPKEWIYGENGWGKCTAFEKL